MDGIAWQLQLWLEQTRDHMLLLLDDDGIVNTALGAIERIFGYTPDDVAGRTVSLFFVPEDRALGLDRHELTSARRVGQMEDDRWMLRKDGARIWVAGVVTALHDAAGRPAGFAKVMRDQTKARGETEALRNRVKSVQQLEDDAIVRSGVLAHELRNPLGALVTASELLRRICTDQKAGTPRQIIDRQLSILSRLVDDVMDATRMQTGKLQLQFKPIELQAALRRVVEPRLVQARARRVDLTLSLPEVP